MSVILIGGSVKCPAEWRETPRDSIIHLNKEALRQFTDDAPYVAFYPLCKDQKSVTTQDEKLRNYYKFKDFIIFVGVS